MFCLIEFQGDLTLDQENVIVKDYIDAMKYLADMFGTESEFELNPETDRILVWQFGGLTASKMLMWHFSGTKFNDRATDVYPSGKSQGALRGEREPLIKRAMREFEENSEEPDWTDELKH